MENPKCYIPSRLDGFTSLSKLSIGDCFFDPWQSPCKVTKIQEESMGFGNVTMKCWYYYNRASQIEEYALGELIVYPISQALYDAIVYSEQTEQNR